MVQDCVGCGYGVRAVGSEPFVAAVVENEIGRLVLELMPVDEAGDAVEDCR